MADYDLAVIGGGINGTGIARDAAGRGLRVLLLEQNDLGSGTSSASTKLIHGGLRYLEHGFLHLVFEASSVTLACGLQCLIAAMAGVVISRSPRLSMRTASTLRASSHGAVTSRPPCFAPGCEPMPRPLPRRR